MRRGLLALILLGVTGLAPWGAVSTVQAASATASNDAVTVEAEGGGVLAVQTEGMHFNVYVSDDSAPVTVTLAAKYGGKLVEPDPGTTTSLPVAYRVEFPTNPDEEAASGMVRRVEVEVGLENIPVSHSQLPDLDDPRRMCNNAQDLYKKVKYRATVKPAGTTAEVYSAGINAPVTIQGITAGFNENAVKDGDEFWVISGDSVGLYNIVLLHSLTPLSGPQPWCWTDESEFVFKLIVDAGAKSSSPGTTGNANAGDYFVTHNAIVGGVVHAADQDVRRFAWIMTEPQGKYNQYASVKIKAVEKFSDRGSDWALKIYNDAIPRTGDINFGLTYGIVNVGIPPIQGEQDISIFKGEVRVKGPNDDSFTDAPTAQTQIKTSDLGFFQFTKKQSISVSVSKTTHLNHYKVGDATSRLEAHSRATVSGGYIGGNNNQHLHGSWGDVKFTKVVEVMADSEFELTTQSTP